MTGEIVNDVGRVLGATLFLTAGALRLAHWRMTGEARSAYMGAALVVLGGLALPLWHLARFLDDGVEPSLSPTLTRAVGTAVCVLLVGRALAHGDDDSLPLRPPVTVLRAAAVTAGGFLLLLLMGALSPGALQGGRGAHLTLEAGMACAWWGAALAAFLRPPSQRWAARAAPLLAAMGVVELLRMVETATGISWRLPAVVLTAVVASAAGYRALTDLFEAGDAANDRALELAAALDTANEGTTRRDAWREELTHDLRSAVAAVRAALHTLTAYDTRLDTRSARELREAALVEVEHMAHLVDGAVDEEVVNFEVAPVVRDVVRIRRATGQEVRLNGSAGVVRGRPGDLATVLQNLLVNAQAHAAGSPVSVQLTSTASHVEIAVSDRGPGLTAAEAEQAFTRGSRGVSSEGSGLGLYVARSLMRKHGGDVELRNRVGGATFVVVLAGVERRSARRGPAQAAGRE